LRDHEGEFRRRKVSIAIVTFENDFFARSYVEETSLTWPLLIDNSRETYASYGMLKASFLDIWGPRSWWAYLQEILKGRLPKSSHGDIFQRGGDVLIDPDGIVRLHHVGAGPAGRPDVATILQKINR
jgi:alkyl hydroperoxide reductase subunit AhpC